LISKNSIIGPVGEKGFVLTGIIFLEENVFKKWEN
jgi:hypothetical protein